MVLLFYPVIFTAKFFTTLKNPFTMHRGMDFYHDVVDWIGGYPYEYATARQVIDFVTEKGFKLKSYLPNKLIVGNNQFVFIKNP